MSEKRCSPRDIELAVQVLATMRYFPSESRAAIAEELVRMVPHQRALEWLMEQCRVRIADWPGLPELRGVLCWRFDAADGIDSYCSLPGYRPLDGEARLLADHQQIKTQEQVGGSVEIIQALEQLRPSSKGKGEMGA